jgi:Sulfotransferase family
MIYLFQHLPKCGGNSFIKSWAQWFTVPTVPDYAGSYPGKERIEEFAKNRVDFDRLPADTLVHGHLVRKGIHPHERYTDIIGAGKCRLISIVRDPLERAISGYYHRERVGRRRETTPTLAEFLARLENPIAKQLGCLKVADRKAWLDEYLFFVVCDQMQFSLDVLATKLGRSPIDAQWLNRSPRGDYGLANDDIARFGTRNTIDYEIFDYAVSRLQREAAELGVAETAGVSS